MGVLFCVAYTHRLECYHNLFAFVNIIFTKRGKFFMSGADMVKEINIKLLELGMSKQAFTQLTGISRSSLSQWNTGRNMPSEEAIRKINSVLGTKFELSEKTDSIYDTIKMLQELRDSERALLQVTKGMTDDEIIRTTEFIKTLKGET